MSEHTPGPWIVHEGYEIDVRSANPADLAEAPIYYCIAENIGGHVRGKNFDDYREVHANARLIAAAPDLLAALEDVRKRMHDSEHWWIDCPERGGFDIGMIDAAIAKARSAQ